MKFQYIGDSKDSFKWDYLHYLTSAMKYPLLNIAFMMTPDGGSGHGNSPPERFPADKSVIKFCELLKGIKENRNNANEKYLKEFTDRITKLPKVLEGSHDYKIKLHKGTDYFTKANGKEYFSDFNKNEKQIVFADPDIGFEPKDPKEAHITYSQVRQILDQISDDSILIVFQDFKRVRFMEHFEEIKGKLNEKLNLAYPPTAIFSNNLKKRQSNVVSIAKKKEILKKVKEVNKVYVDSKNGKVEQIE